MSSQRQPVVGWRKAVNDIIAGTCGGISVTLVGHPFDTLKVRLQTQPMDKPIYSENFFTGGVALLYMPVAKVTMQHH